MKKDDRQLGRILSRREALALFRAAGTAMLVGCIPRKSNTAQLQSSVSVQASTASYATLPACVVSPEQTEGPYFVDEKLKRSDIRSDPSDGSVKSHMAIGVTGCSNCFNGDTVKLQSVSIFDVLIRTVYLRLFRNNTQAACGFAQFVSVYYEIADPVIFAICDLLCDRLSIRLQKQTQQLEQLQILRKALQGN
jgi:hypothetical protein